MAPVPEEIDLLKGLLERGERTACRRGLEALRARFKKDPTAFESPSILALKALALDLETLPDLESALKATFGYGAFRPGQRTIIEAVLAGRDVVGIMPTGAGKSGLASALLLKALEQGYRGLFVPNHIAIEEILDLVIRRIAFHQEPDDLCSFYGIDIRM